MRARDALQPQGVEAPEEVDKGQPPLFGNPPEPVDQALYF
jgi:hypothetical protein